MKMAIIKNGLVMVAFCAVGTLAFAQGAPPAGAGGPPGAGGPTGGGAAMTQQVDSAEDTARKAVVQNFGDLIDQGKADEAFAKYMSRDFVDHSYMAKRMMKKDKPGYDDVLPFFKNWMARRADEGNKKLVAELVVNDDMVTYNGRRGQDIFRVVNGKITDHWDTLHQHNE